MRSNSSICTPASWDEPPLDMEGLKPLEMEFAAIDAITDTREVPGLVAHLTKIRHRHVL